MRRNPPAIGRDGIRLVSEETEKHQNHWRTRYNEWIDDIARKFKVKRYSNPDPEVQRRLKESMDAFRARHNKAYGIKDESI